MSKPISLIKFSTLLLLSLVTTSSDVQAFDSDRLLVAQADLSHKPKLGATPKLGGKPKLGATPKLGGKPKLGAAPKLGGKPKLGKVAPLGKVPIPRGAEAITMKVSKDGCEHRLSIFGDTLFDFDKFDLTEGAEDTLSALGPMIRERSKNLIVIEGHTDSIGTDAYNKTLSLNRAKAVNKWLLDNGFLSKNAEIKGFGESRPVAQNTYSDGSDNPEGRQKNRRVEIVIDTCH